MKVNELLKKLNLGLVDVQFWEDDKIIKYTDTRILYNGYLLDINNYILLNSEVKSYYVVKARGIIMVLLINIGKLESENKKINKLEKAKEIIKGYYENAKCGIFDSRNHIGDVMNTIYKDEGLMIDLCYAHEYFEVFGLSNAEFEELSEYYNSL